MPELKVKDPRITRAICLINAGFDQNFDFKSLAETLNLSPSRLQHLFKEETGMSFRKYLQQVRMKKAEHLLETTFLCVNEIAKQVGIGDCSHFVRDFEKQYGLSPNKYRKRYLSAKKNPLFKLR